MIIQGGDLIAAISGGVMESIDVPSAPVGTLTPTVLDIRLRPKIATLITKYGKNIRFDIYPTESYRPDKGDVLTGDLTSYTKKCIPPYEVEKKYINGDTIQIGDLLTGLAGYGLDFDPQLATIASFDGVSYKIMKVGKIFTGELIGLYVFLLRK